jgi:hypothetical protein
MILALILSIGLHLAAFSLLATDGGGSTKQGTTTKENGTKQGAGTPERLSIRVPGTIRLPSKVSSKEAEAKEGSGNDCPEEEAYYGIGIMVSLVRNELNRCTITSVAKGGPADRRGIRAGDSYIPEGLQAEEGRCIIKGEKGSALQLKLWRGDSGEPTNLTIVRERICSDVRTEKSR